MRRNTIALLILIVVSGLFVWYTQLSASTPAIENANETNESIAELREVNLNGRKEWISIRGSDINNPILLFLAGGPGGSQMAATRYELAALEKHFTIVNWDQPGSGKSFYAMDIQDITVDTYIEDGVALTNYLLDTFHQDKLYLLGESWGSALGIFLADQAPQLYHAVLGTGQMIDFKATELLDYQKAIEIAKSKNDEAKVKKLESNGLPPYYGDNITWKYSEYLQYLTNEMMRNPNVHNGGYNTLRDIFSNEYGILDKINFARGIITTFNHVYQQLYDIDLRTDYANIEVPVYFLLGRHDINAPTQLVEEYYRILDAPKKSIIWFENSAHSPWINERNKFIEEVIKVKLDM